MGDILRGGRGHSKVSVFFVHGCACRVGRPHMEMDISVYLSSAKSGEDLT